MNIIEIPITECKSGDLLAADIFDDNGIALAVREAFLNEYIIHRLKGYGVSKIRIFEKTESKTKQFIRHNYIKSVELLKNAVKDLISGRGLNYQDISTTSELIYLGINEKNTIVQCLNEIKNGDDYTYTHCINTAFYSMLISKWLGLSLYETKLSIEAGLLHDIGKVKIPKEVLNKKGKLADEEYELMKNHTVFGFDLVKDAEDIRPEVKQAVLQHHERFDRSGYPLRVSPEELNLCSKIVAIADVYDAMTSERIYKKRSTPFEALEMFKTIGMSLFDLTVLNTFLKNLPNCYIGSKALLKNGLTGEIAYIPPQDILNPIIKLEDEYVEMQSHSDYQIVKII